MRISSNFKRLLELGLPARIWNGLSGGKAAGAYVFMVTFVTTRHFWPFLLTELVRGLSSPLSLVRLKSSCSPSCLCHPFTRTAVAFSFFSPLFLGYVPQGWISGEQTNLGLNLRWLFGSDFLCCICYHGNLGWTCNVWAIMVQMCKNS